MSLETLLEAVNYVEKKETVSSNDQYTKDVTTEMASASSKSNSNLKHWRKRAVAQSVLESQKQDLGRFDDKYEFTNEASACCQGSIASVSSLKVPEITRVSAFAPYTTKIGTDALVLPQSSEHSNSVPYALVSASKRFILDGISTEVGSSANTMGISTTVTDEALSKSNGIFLEACHLYFMVLRQRLANDGARSSQQSEVLEDRHESGEMQTTYTSPNKDKQKVPQGAVTRETHNLLEKNRRAHLKECFDNLRHVIPALGMKKVSNLTVLREALKYVQAMKRKEQRQQHDVESLVREKIAKKEKLSQLCRDLGPVLQKERIEEILKSCEKEGVRKINQTAFNPDPPRTAVPESLLCLKPPGNDDTSAPSEVVNPAHPVLPIAGCQSCSTFSTAVDISRTSAAIVTCTTGGSVKLQSWPILQTKNGSAFKPLSTHTSSAVPPSSVPGPISNGINAGLCWQPGSAKLSHVSTNPSDSTFFANLEQCVLSATSHRISSIRAYTSNVPTTAMGKFIDNPPNQLKIVVKHVDSAKQQALASRAQNAKSISTGTANRVSAGGKLLTGRTRTTELVFRPRSSVTPPPPSKIMPYFPRFSVGSGGSPPLTSVLPNQGEGMPRQELESSHSDEQVDQFKGWGKGSEMVSSLSFPVIVPPKRKQTNISIKGLPLKFPKAATTQSIHSLVEGVSTSTDPLPSHPLMPSAVLFPQTNRNNKSVTQVCYSTLMGPVRPTISSTIYPTIDDESLSKQDKKDAGNRGLSSQSEVALPFSSTEHVNGSFPPGVGSQATTARLLTPVISSSNTLSWTLGKGQDSGSKLSSGIANVNDATVIRPGAAPKPFLTSQVKEEKGEHISSATTQPQPQIQYVIPMGYAGVMGGGGTSTVGFSPALGGFMQVASMPQGQQWGYMIPQNMVFAPVSQSGPAASVESAQISKSSSDDGPLTGETGNMGTDWWKNLQTQSKQKELAESSSSLHESSDDVDAVGPCSWQIQSGMLQPQFQLLSPHFQAGSQIVIPMGNNIRGGGYIVGGAMAPAAPELVSGVRHENSVGYGIPMNIVGYPIQLAVSSPMQLAAVPNGALSFQRGQHCSMQTQVSTMSDDKETSTGIQEAATWSATNTVTLQTAKAGEADLPATH